MWLTVYRLKYSKIERGLVPAAVPIIAAVGYALRANSPYGL